MSSVSDISSSKFPAEGEIEEKIRFWLGYAIQAPSAHNTQPWQCKINKNVLHVYRDPAHTLGDSDPSLRETILSLGAFVENFVIAANAFGYKTTVRNVIEHQQDMHIAEVSCTVSTQATKDTEMLDGILQRHTNRGAYTNKPLPKDFLEIISEIQEPDTRIFVFTPEQHSRQIQEISDLVGKGTTIALSMRPMQKELTDLVSLHHEGQETGMTVESLAEKGVTAKTGEEWVNNHLDPIVEGKNWQKNYAAAPLIVVVGTVHDGPHAWFGAARVMERILVHAARYNIVHAISAAPIEIPTLVPELRKLIDSKYRPQMLTRIGYPENPKFTVPTNRRKDIIID